MCDRWLLFCASKSSDNQLGDEGAAAVLTACRLMPSMRLIQLFGSMHSVPSSAPLTPLQRTSSHRCSSSVLRPRRSASQCLCKSKHTKHDCVQHLHSLCLGLMCHNGNAHSWTRQSVVAKPMLSTSFSSALAEERQPLRNQPRWPFSARHSVKPFPAACGMCLRCVSMAVSWPAASQTKAIDASARS